MHYLQVICPVCGAKPGFACKDKNGKAQSTHASRVGATLKKITQTRHYSSVECPTTLVKPSPSMDIAEALAFVISEGKKIADMLQTKARECGLICDSHPAHKDILAQEASFNTALEQASQTLVNYEKERTTPLEKSSIQKSKRKG